MHRRFQRLSGPGARRPRICSRRICHLSHEDKQGPRLTGSRMPAPGLRGRARHTAVRARRPRANRSGCFERRRRCRWACSVLCPAWRLPRRPRWGSAFLSGARARMDEPPKGDPGLLPVCLEANRSGRLSLCPTQAARCALGGCGRWTAPAWPPACHAIPEPQPTWSGAHLEHQPWVLVGAQDSPLLT